MTIVSKPRPCRCAAYSFPHRRGRLCAEREVAAADDHADFLRDERDFLDRNGDAAAVNAESARLDYWRCRT